MIKLDKIIKTADPEATYENGVYNTKNIYVCKHKVAKPRVFIPVFPGTNCEYDSTRAFERAGAEVDVKVFKNLSAEDIRDSVEIFEKSIDQAQMIMFPGGFSAGDEPDGSAKFFATAFQNAKIKEAVMKLLNERDGLALGICNGFQALIKLGLVPYGEICGQKEDSPTLTYNTIGRHISKMVYTKVMSNKSPWLAQAEVGKIYTNPASHGEGRFVADQEWIKKLLANGQVATRYVDPEGNFDQSEEWNINGSYYNIEGITSPDGRVFGKMAHSERRDVWCCIFQIRALKKDAAISLFGILLHPLCYTLFMILYRSSRGNLCLHIRISSGWRNIHTNKKDHWNRSPVLFLHYLICQSH